jgi:hypothetical protein
VSGRRKPDGSSTVRRVADTDPTLRRDRRALRDLAAVLLIVAGTVGAVTCAFRVDQLAGWASVSVLSLCVGIFLAYEP